MMTSATVEPDVYENHTDEVVQAFYDQFMAKTQRYKDLTLEKFRGEYVMMAHTLYVYCEWPPQPAACSTAACSTAACCVPSLDHKI